MAISVIGLTQSMPLHILDCVLYLTNIMKEIEWVRFDWTYSLMFLVVDRVLYLIYIKNDMEWIQSLT